MLKWACAGDVSFSINAKISRNFHPFLEPTGTECRFELAEIFRKGSAPAQVSAEPLGMFEGEDFGVQGLSRKVDDPIGGVRAAKGKVIGAVADQGQSGVRGLGADLMFSAGFELEPQFGDDTPAIRQGILGHDFIMGDGLAGRVSGGAALRISQDILMHFIPAQLQGLPPCTLRIGRPAFDKGYVLTLHGVRLKLFDQVLARGRARGHAKDAAGIFVETMNRQRTQLAIGRWD